MSYKPSVPMAAGTRPAAYGTHAPHPVPAAPSGTFAPGTKIQVGSHKVIIQKYFSEGGFAHVYLVKMPEPKDGTDIAVLKRVAVPDKDSLANMRTEVETMKKLKGHRPIVTYYDSHASQLKGGGYEVFLLMEFCNGGGLIDFMNTRLQNRLTEPEILKIFSDVTEGVACMHYLKPPLLHRDLKVENVLISKSAGGTRYKLCDFGSTAPPRPAATTAAECRLIEDDVQKHTTLQYRSPEMVDVYRKQPIDEKSDIWALGVLLYKLCYYTTPFEDQGQLAILNASYKYPAYPAFSDNLKKLIASMLRENPRQRPNVYQVLREACLMQGIEVPIKDIYAGRTESESRRNQALPTPSHISSAAGAAFASPVHKKPVIPDVVPMRRGRPTTTPQASTPKPNHSPMRVTSSDPFAALDAKSTPMVDEISSRFPSLDQFSLLHEQGSKFEFDNSPPTSTKSKDLSQRVTEKLADDAFAASAPRITPTPPSQTTVVTSATSRAQKIISRTPDLQPTISAPSAVAPPPAASYRPTSSYVSEGTMTSPSPHSTEFQQQQQYKPQPIHRFPSADEHRSSSLPLNRVSTELDPLNRGLITETSRPTSVSRNRSFQLRAAEDNQAASSRPSLEGGRPSNDFVEPIPRTKSTDPRPRPSSAYLESHMDYLREKESLQSQSHSKPKFRSKSKTLSNAKNIDTTQPYKSSSGSASPDDDAAIESNVEFLRKMEDQQDSSRGHKSRNSLSNPKNSKRTSLPSMSLSGTKNLFAGKFGDAFKRFENNAAPPTPRTPSPSSLDIDRRFMTPIAGSEATDDRSDDGRADDDLDADALTSEQRREQERRRLSVEERRVSQAAAEYRQRLADRDASLSSLSGGPQAPPRSIGGVSRASTIQNKVKTLLDENEKPSPTKTAHGYGRYTVDGAGAAQQDGAFEEQRPPPVFAKPPVAARKPLVVAAQGGRGAGGGVVAGPAPPQGRPCAPPKPVHLHTGSSSGASASASGSGKALPPAPYMSPRPSSARLLSSSPPKPAHLMQAVQMGPGQLMQSAQLMQAAPMGLPLPAPAPTPLLRQEVLRVDMSPREKDEYIREFSRRYPSLSGIEMVETVVGEGGRAGGV